jgi:hypothetical protein
MNSAERLRSEVDTTSRHNGRPHALLLLGVEAHAFGASDQSSQELEVGVKRVVVVDKHAGVGELSVREESFFFILVRINRLLRVRWIFFRTFLTGFFAPVGGPLRVRREITFEPDPCVFPIRMRDTVVVARCDRVRLDRFPIGFRIIGDVHRKDVATART